MKNHVRLGLASMAIAGLTTVVAYSASIKPLAPSDETGTASPIAAAVPLNYSTGFEPGEGFVPGWVENQPAANCPAGPGCWKVTAAANRSLTQGHIDTFPFAGTQNLRLSYDPTTRTNQSNAAGGQPAYGGLGIDARSCGGAVTTCVVNTGIDAAMGGMMAIRSPLGMNYKIQPQSPVVFPGGGGVRNAIMMFYNNGGIYAESVPGTYDSIGTWDTTGGYKQTSITFDSCTGETIYHYDNVELFRHPSYGRGDVQQFLIFGDNFPAPGGDLDFDDLVITSRPGPCPSECGNGIYEPPVESCEPGVQECNPGHTCTDCVCNRTCTLDAPCELNNGANGPFYGPFDASFGGIFVYESPPGVEAVSVELCGSTGADQRIFYWGSCTDPADAGANNDDCYNGYAGADPTASCYDEVTAPNYESCTCHDLPLAGDNCWLLQIRPPAGAGQIHIEVNKKAECFLAGGHLGACCDTNGADSGCTENVIAADCSGPDKVWTENGKCATVQCACIPECDGRNCGDDGCGGMCPNVPCDDSNVCTDDSCNPADGQCVFTNNTAPCGDGNACNGDEVCAGGACAPGTPLVCNDNDACNGVETCNPSSGCVPGQPLNCDNGLACDGAETCNPSSGCVSGTPVNCDDGQECSVDTCNEPAGTCSSDTSACSIPTVSEWGLVVLTLMLLIGAKVYFGRRQAIA